MAIVNLLSTGPTSHWENGTDAHRRCPSSLGRAARVSPRRRAGVARHSCHGAWAMDSSKAASGMAMNAPMTMVLTTRDPGDETLTPTDARAPSARRQPARSAPLAGSACPVSTNRGLYPVAVASRRNRGPKPGGVQGQDPASFDRGPALRVRRSLPFSEGKVARAVGSEYAGVDARSWLDVVCIWRVTRTRHSRGPRSGGDVGFELIVEVFFIRLWFYDVSIPV